MRSFTSFQNCVFSMTRLIYPHYEKLYFFPELYVQHDQTDLPSLWEALLPSRTVCSAWPDWFTLIMRSFTSFQNCMFSVTRLIYPHYEKLYFLPELYVQRDQTSAKRKDVQCDQPPQASADQTLQVSHNLQYSHYYFYWNLYGLKKQKRNYYNDSNSN